MSFMYVYIVMSLPASSGLLMIASQASVVAITVMGWAYTQTGSFTSSLVGITVLLILSALVLFKIKESAILTNRKD
jgi:hypothetical protein